MRSTIYQGEVFHVRQAPVGHRFRYPVYFYAFDLDELPELSRTIALFGYNRVRPVAIHDRDYLHPGVEPLREKVRRVLRDGGMETEVQRIVLVTSARFFNYVFNPVSFFYCYDSAGRLLSILVQVNNTFGEMHLYLLPGPLARRSEGRWIFSVDKQFHVSPFFPREGDYTFLLTEPEKSLDNVIRYRRDGQPALTARLQGEARELTNANLLSTLLRSPFSAALTMPRILWQAARLYWQRRLPVYHRPVPDHSMTIRPVPPSFLDRLGMRLFFRLLSRLPGGELRVTLPDGSRRSFGLGGTEPSPSLFIRDYRFFRRVIFSGAVGFGETYTDGDWTTDDLPGLLTLLATHLENIDDRTLITTAAGRWWNLLRHRLRSNTLRGSARNIHDHYDLSNRFFSTFLDPDMTYSSALFAQGAETLEEAQRHKLRTVIRKAGITRDDHVLEIGCGWGSFAIEAVRQTGCRVTGVTLSREQLQWARERVREAGLEGRIELQLKDYRHIEGRYSKIVSIEMLEAVGHEGLKTFFSVCDRALLPGGTAVIQVITIADRKYDRYCSSSDWIRKHVFPGGHLPSLGALAQAVGEGGRLRIGSLEQYGSDYSRTLDCWRQRFLARRRELTTQGYDAAFLRTWDYYLSYCMAGFDAGTIDLALMVLRKPPEFLHYSGEVPLGKQAA